MGESNYRYEIRLDQAIGYALMALERRGVLDWSVIDRFLEDVPSIITARRAQL